MTLNWTQELVDQLDWHWRGHLRARFDGLTDDEYFWEPVPGCWSIRPPPEGGDPRGYALDFERPEPDPPPVTTIAWRLAHLSGPVLGQRASDHLGAMLPTVWAANAADGLSMLDGAYDAWISGVRALDDNGLARPWGPAEGPFAAYPFAALVLHINREVLHHGAEIALLRDLYRAGKLPGG